MGVILFAFHSEGGQFPMELSVVIPNLREAIICYLEVPFGNKVLAAQKFPHLDIILG